MNGQHTIVTFSHLRWDFVFQRPQHLLSRLASTYRVIFIEEPDTNESNRPEWSLREASPNVLIAMPRTPSAARGFHSDQTPYLKPLLRELLEREKLTDYIVWFYTAMAAPLASPDRDRTATSSGAGGFMTSDAPTVDPDKIATDMSSG